MIEYEMKFKCEHSIILPKLHEINAVLVKTLTNTDQYYNHPNRDFKKTDEALRIRETETNKYVTYKGPKLGTESKSRLEINVELGSDGMNKILEALDFKTSGIVNKTREVWEYEDIVITLDNVENLGEYVELEVEGKIQEKEEKISTIKSLAVKLGLEPMSQISKSYLELLEEM